MNLAKRLQEAADRRRREPPPLTTVELKPRQRHDVTIDLDEHETAQDPAIDLRTAVPHLDVRHVDRGLPQYTELDANDDHPWPLVTVRPGARRARREAELAAERLARRLADIPPESRACPRCGEPARLDINDRTRGVLHLSCDACFKMWQVPSKPSTSTAV
ncbi:MAG TPA: hypothetical protein VF183_02225 [Acidimicrobiales bacterium]